MSDLISRQAAIDTVSKWFYDVCIAESDGTATIFKRLRELPSAQPERKRGKWIPHESVFGGSKEMVYTCDQCGHNIGFHMENYCSSCGADMRGEEHD